ncbi:MAG: hypothetical protein IT364_03005 [Candidatus Hydrogenedentes bacterium]|nr:hypothetical protein [Candidatus Hydrogenedentota bacterium]
MKHISLVTKTMPARADLWQDIVCEVTGVVVRLLEVKGGSVPLLTFLDEKCQPNPVLEQ